MNSMKNGKAPGSSDIISKMVEASLETSSEEITLLVNAIIRERAITLERNTKYVINISKEERITHTVDLKKGFHSVPRKVMWWAMKVMDISEWIITLVKATYGNVKSKDRVDCECNNVFSR